MESKELTKYPSEYKGIMDKVTKSICTFSNKNARMAIGFFCKLPYKANNGILFFLIINNICIKEEDTESGSDLQIIINNKKTVLKIDNSRKIYRENKKDGITIIEIKPSDNLDLNSFLDLDSDIMQDNSENMYINKLVYLIKFPYEKRPEIFKRTVKNVNSENYEIEKYYPNEEISIGSPIINLDNFKIIGIHKGFDNKNNVNIGNFIKKPIKQYIQKNIIEAQEIRDNSITIIYKSFRRHKIKLFGKTFVENNKDLCTMIVNGEEREICESIENDNIKRIYLKIKLKNVNKLTNLHYMFLDCICLYSLPDLEKWDTSNVTIMRSLFNGCSSLKIVSGISNWNTANVVDMRYMFSQCSSLEVRPDISNWKTDNLKNISGFFNECAVLKEIPDISNWNISNVEDLSYLFCSCSLITNLPDISNWNTNNVEDMSRLFSLCKNLKHLPDISNWETNKVENMMQMFEYCTSLTKLPDISNWNTNKVINLMGMFNNCSLLKDLPDISKWNTEYVRNIQDMFKGCKLLRYLPDISNWKTKNIIFMSNLFEGCSSLLYLPDISKWDIHNVINMNNLFCDCFSLSELPDISKWETDKFIETTDDIFKGCCSLVTIPSIKNWKIKNKKNISNMFNLCISLSYIPYSSEFDNNDLMKQNKIINECLQLMGYEN